MTWLPDSILSHLFRHREEQVPEEAAQEPPRLAHQFRVCERQGHLQTHGKLILQRVQAISIIIISAETESLLCMSFSSMLFPSFC
jgi:hypothetical protein